MRNKSRTNFSPHVTEKRHSLEQRQILLDRPTVNVENSGRFDLAEGSQFHLVNVVDRRVLRGLIELTLGTDTDTVGLKDQ